MRRVIGPVELETWRPCLGYPKHEVSSLGAVRRRSTGRRLKGYVTTRGYRRVALRRGRGGEPFVHQLVAVAFHGDHRAALTVDHLNHDKLDNRASNLRWLSLELNSIRWWHARDGQGRNVWATKDLAPEDLGEHVDPLTPEELAELAAAWAS